MREILWLCAAQLGRQASDHVFEFGVRASSGNQVGEILAQMMVVALGQGRPPSEVDVLV
jgi:hypothetical protein